MKIAAVAYPVGAVVAASLALGATVAMTVRTRTPAPLPEPVYVPTPVSALDLSVPDNARYWSIDLDGDGTPELVAETADHTQAVIVHAYGQTPIATIPLRFPGNPCQSELGIEEGRLTAHDYAGPDCHESEYRRFRIRDGQLATVTIWDTQITIVDN